MAGRDYVFGCLVCLRYGQVIVPLEHRNFKVAFYERDWSTIGAFSKAADYSCFRVGHLLEEWDTIIFCLCEDIFSCLFCLVMCAK